MTYKTYRDITHYAFLNIKCISNLDQCVYSLILCCEINVLPLHINLQSCMATLLFVFAYFVFDHMILWNRIKGFITKKLMTYYGNLTVSLCLPKTAFKCTLYRLSFFQSSMNLLNGFSISSLLLFYFCS